MKRPLHLKSRLLLILLIFSFAKVLFAQSNFWSSLKQGSSKQDKHSESLTPDEKNNIDVFKKAHKSVVYIINSQLVKDFFSLNLSEIPQGTGTGFVWDKS